jgi:deoxyribonuclease-4
VPREEPVEERGVDASDVEEAGGARREANDRWHAPYRRGVFIGAHVSSAGGIHTAIERAVEMRADSVQVFTQSPRMWRPTNPPAGEPRTLQGAARGGRHRRRSLSRALPDQPRDPKDDFYEKSVAALSNTVDVGCAIDADGVVFHVGSHLGAGMDAGLKRVVKAMKKVLDRCSDTTWLLMENCAGTGATIGRSIEELAVIFDRLDGHPRLGVCLDSCHLYASGYDVTNRRALERLLDEVDELDRTRPAARAARQRLEAPSARTATGTPTSAPGCWAKTSASSSPIRSCRSCPRSSRCRARTATGPTRSRSAS